MFLRRYQSSAVARVIELLDKRPILVSPTGSGKTVMASALVDRLKLPTLWLAHRKELIDQAAASLGRLGMAVGIIKSGVAPMPLARTQVASVQTLVRRDKPEAELIVVDEAHHITGESYRSIVEMYPHAKLVGLTATPFRLDGRGMGDMFGELVVSATTRQLCDDGYLHAPKVWSSTAPDLRGVKVVAGDYSLAALAKRVNDPQLNADVVKTWQKLASGKRTACFAIDIEHSLAIASAFQRAGVCAEHLDGSTPADQRDAILARLASGRTQIVCNCMVLTEGWDLPALECAIVARPTASLNLHLQMIGRVMRACDGKDGAIVLDHAGNHHVHGLATRVLNYSLDGSVRVGTDEPLGIKRCRQCGLMYDSDLGACPECGHAAEPITRDRPTVEGSGELSEFDDSSFEYRQQMWRLIEAQREAAGYAEGWSYFRFKDRFGVAPVVVESELIDPARATMDQKRAVYEQLARVAQEKGFASGWVAHRFKEYFGVWPRGMVGEARRASLSQRWKERVA